MTDETFLMLYRVTTILGGAGAILGAWLYHRWHAWRSTAVGRHLMAFNILLGVVLLLSGLHSFAISYPYQRSLVILLLAAVAGGTWHRVAFVIAKHREHQNGQ